MEKTRKRIVWIDTAKGIGMLLVILGHILTAFSRQTDNSNILNALPVKIIVSFHMPLFFFLSGIFVKSILKKNFLVVCKDKFKRLMVPYFAWGVVSVFFFSIYTHKFQWLRILELPIRPIFVLWFVYSLFISMLVFYILEKKCNKLIILIISLIMYIAPILVFGT